MADFIDRQALGIGKCDPKVFENKAYIKSAYCPHCGTKMDGKGGEQNENHTIYAF